MDLNVFCAKHAPQLYQIERPFSFGAYTYATNGHICIRVPRLPEIGESEAAPNPEKLFNEASARAVTLWQPLPPFELKADPCGHCKGSGKVKDCPWCKGHTTCKRCYQSFGQVPASAADHNAEDCEECEGTGKIEDPGDIVVDGALGRARVSAVYLARIADLPGVEIAVHDETSTIRIRFDGGEGLLMPMRI